MSIGLGVVLLVLGAIFAFAVEVPIPGVDGNALGYILMLGGLIALAVSAVTASSKRKSSTVAVTHDAKGNEHVEERHTKHDTV
jgi:hypothetical protein